MKKVTYFNCDEDLSVHDIADGPVTFCAISADGAIPDNPHGPKQGSTAENANRSGRVCDSIVVDRTPPQATVTADRTTVLTGDLVSFGVQASDATSGLAGDYAWKWGDDAADGTGAAPRRLKLTSRTRTLPIGLTTEGPGTVALALVRGGKVHARGTLRIAAAGTLGYKLRLPRKLQGRCPPAEDLLHPPRGRHRHDEDGPPAGDHRQGQGPQGHPR